MTLPVGTAVGTIIVEEKLASSAHGDLYAARQPGLGRRVAVRVLRRDLLEDAALVERLRREATLASRVSHPCLIQAHDYFSLRGDHYLVLDFVDGPTLRATLEGAGGVPPHIAARICLEVARGLEELHLHGVIHTQLRPEHILLSRWGEVKIKGLAGGREVGEEPPTEVPALSSYSAPELRGQGRIDPRADLYSLGALLHELLSGQPPHAGRIQLPRRPWRLIRLARACLAPDPAARPSLTEAIDGLTGFLSTPSGPECRLEISAWLWEVRILSREEEPLPEIDPAEQPAPRRAVGEAITRLWPRLRPLWVTAGVAALAFGAWSLRELVVPGGIALTRSAAAPTPARIEVTPPVDAAAQPSASLRIAVSPWAEVQVDDLPPFLTPRASPLSLNPGQHTIVLRHPRFGEERREVLLDSGENLVLEHSFMEPLEP